MRVTNNENQRVSDSFNGLVGSSGSTTTTTGVLLGYAYRNAWGVETGVTYVPVHLNITIQSSPTSYVFNYQTIGYDIPLRIKRRIGSGSKGQNGTGFWVSPEAWLHPDGNNQPDALHFTGRSGYGRRAPVDTLLLGINTTTANHISGLAELGIEYAPDCLHGWNWTFRSANTGEWATRSAPTWSTPLMGHPKQKVPSPPMVPAGGLA